MTTSVLVADDHGVMRQGLCKMLSEQPDLQVVGDAEDGQAAVELARQLLPDVVVLDVVMPNLNGMEAARRILAKRPQTKIIALSGHADRHLVEGMLKAGACAYVLKHCAVDELVQAIHSVRTHRTYLSPDIADLIVEDYVRHPQTIGEPLSSVLSSREREVLQLLAEGHAVKEAAFHLHVSSKTVQTHRRHIMEKLNVHSTAELVKFAVREGVTSLEF